jgi:hypothetical protein
MPKNGLAAGLVEDDSVVRLRPEVRKSLPHLRLRPLLDYRTDESVGIAWSTGHHRYLRRLK